jgi:hypothetical membrane protein
VRCFGEVGFHRYFSDLGFAKEPMFNSSIIGDGTRYFVSF